MQDLMLKTEVSEKIKTELPVLNIHQICKNVSRKTNKQKTRVTYKLLDQEKVFLVDCNAFVE